MAADPGTGNLAKMFKRFLRGKETDEMKKAAAAKEEQPKRTAAVVEAKAVREKQPATKPKREKRVSNVEKARRIEEEEAEEFEVVEGARPAVCIGKRKAKIKWKKDEDSEKKAKEDKQDDGPGSSSAESPPSPTQKELNVEPLKDAVAELTLEKQRLKEMVERLRKRLVRRDKKIDNLQKELKAKGSGPSPPFSEQQQAGLSPSATAVSPATAPDKDNLVAQIQKELETTKAQLAKQTQEAESSKAEIQKLLDEAKKNTAVAPTPVRVEKGEKKKKKKKDLSVEEVEPDGVTTSTATRILAVIKRNQLLEKALPVTETSVLHKYFSAGGTAKASQEVLVLLDKAIGAGIDTLVSRPQDLDDPIDNQMRSMLMQGNKVKSLLLEVMLAQPSYVPHSWGGKTLLAQSNRRHNAPPPPTQQPQQTSGVAPKKETREKEQESSYMKSYVYPVTYPKK